MLIIFIVTFQFSAFGQTDTIKTQQETLELNQIRFIDCNHGHICCQVGCRCCPDSEFGSYPFHQSIDPRLNFPKDDSLTYNQYVGETIAGFTLANGWRRDTLNGGFNKEIYDNPYVESTEFDKNLASTITAYKYQDGKLFTGRIEDTLEVRFTPNKIRGYLSGQPYYEAQELTVILRADCVNGMLQGKGVLVAQLVGFGMYNNLKLSECTFEDGEIVGTVKNYDLNSIDVQIKNEKIYSNEDVYDYFEFIKLLELTEVNYAKGSSKWVERTTFERDKKTGKVKPKTRKYGE